MTKDFNWDATPFFERLTSANRLAQQYHFRFCQVSSLEGFEEALAAMQSTTAFVCISDTANGYMQLDNTPHTRRVKTVFLAMRHPIDDMDARQERMDILRELFRQFMSVLLLEKTKLQQQHIYLDTRISFQEIDRYFASGCACAFFQIATDIYTNLVLNESEWSDNVWDK